MNLMRRLFLAAISFLVPGIALAEESMTPEQISQAVRVESITIPMPGEFFAAIDKKGRPNWTQLVRTGAVTASASRVQIALALGTLVADGYIAVEAEDSQSVKNIGKEIINLARKLNVSQSVLGRSNSINDFATNNDWNALREELEATQNEVKLDMMDQKDTSLVTLVTLGAWLRGTEIASGLVEQAYTPDSAQLLRQPAIIDYLIQQIDSLTPTMRKDPLVVTIRETLVKSRSYVNAQPPSAEAIKDLHTAMAKAVQLITKGGSES